MVPGVADVAESILPANRNHGLPEEAIVGNIGRDAEVVEAMGLELWIGQQAEDRRDHDGNPDALDESHEEGDYGVFAPDVCRPKPFFSESHGGLLRVLIYETNITRQSTLVKRKLYFGKHHKNHQFQTGC